MNETKIEKDISSKTITITRTFDAPISKVWKAWTTSEILEKWWAPKPWTAVTKTFDFSPGGQWLYYMSGPSGEKIWSWERYETIEEGQSFTATDGFCDEEGKVNTDLPQTHWKIEFFDAGDDTDMKITLTFKTEEAMNKLIEMQFEQGFTMGLSNLDEVLK